MEKTSSKGKPLCRTVSEARPESHVDMPDGSNKNHGMRVSPNDLPTNDACQFITKVNDRAFIYRLNFGTYDGWRNMESESA
jgi:hypothetical protein